MKTFKLHFYCLRFLYFLLFLITGLLTSAIYLYDDKLLLYKIIILLFIVFSFFYGIYQYKIISKSYLSISLNHKSFYGSSLLYSFIQLLIIYSFLLGISHLLKTSFLINFNRKFYIYLGLALYGATLLGNTIAIIVRNLKIFEIILLILLTIAILNYKIVLDKVNEYYHLFFFAGNLSYLTISKIGVIYILMTIINYFIYTKLKNPYS